MKRNCTLFQGTRFCVQLFVRDTIDVSKFRVSAPLGELDILFNNTIFIILGNILDFGSYVLLEILVIIVNR